MLESALQSSVCEFLRLEELAGRLAFFAVPNGMFIQGRDPAERAKRVAILKRRGALRPGAPDLVLILPNGKFGAIELKAKKGSLSPEQEFFRSIIESLGGLYAVCRSLAEVQGTLSAWLGVRKAA